MSTRITVDQLEQMKTHELADLLSNLAIMLRRLPDVPCTQLQPEIAKVEDVQPPQPQKKTPARSKKSASTVEEQPIVSDSLPIYTEEELNKKNTTDLKKIIKALHISTSATKKADLIAKILTGQGREHSEQYAILNV
jgi:hypothetical protein